MKLWYLGFPSLPSTALLQVWYLPVLTLFLFVFA